MINSPYRAHAQRSLFLLTDSMTKHHKATLEYGMLGEDPSETLRRAVLFETGCLHLYVLDHELRRDREQDAFLNELWSWLGNWLLQLVPGASGQEPYRWMLGWRLGRYKDVTASIEADESYAALHASIYLNDYLFRLAQQFVQCVSADASVESEKGVFLGIVPDANYSEDAPEDIHRSKLQLTRAVVENLYEFLLPVQQTAILWAENSPFYKKNVTEISALAQTGAKQGESLWQQHRLKRIAPIARGHWEQMHYEGAWFTVGTPPVSRPVNDANGRLPENLLQNDALGRPYLRLSPASDTDPDSIPIRNLLLLAHDQGIGLITAAPFQSTGDTVIDLTLTLGEVDALLRRNTLFSSLGDSDLDLSAPEQLRISRPDAWILSGPARANMDWFYRDSEQDIRRESGQYTGGWVGWATDDTGAGALIIAPANHNALSYMTWMLPPGSLVVGELVPDKAQYSLLDDSDEGGKEEDYDGPSPEGLTVAYDSGSLFLRTHQIVYGSAGEPYEVITQTDDEEHGRPLLDFALPCYDSGRGIALRSKEGMLNWRLGFGDMIGFLRTGKLAAPNAMYGAGSGAEEQRVVFNTTSPVARPDPITFPYVVQRNIRWVLQRAGVTTPQMGVVKNDAGGNILCFGPAPAKPDLDLLHWAMWRIGWYLPIGSPLYAFVDQPNQIPYPMP